MYPKPPDFLVSEDQGANACGDASEGRVERVIAIKERHDAKDPIKRTLCQMVLRKVRILALLPSSLNTKDICSRKKKLESKY